MPHSGLPCRGESVEMCSSGEHGAGAKRKRRHDVGTTPDAGIEQDLHPVTDRVRDVWQHLERGGHMIHLPAAVVGDDDCVRPVVGRPDRLLGAQHPLDRTGPSHSCRIHSRSRQDTVPSNMAAAPGIRPPWPGR